MSRPGVSLASQTSSNKEVLVFDDDLYFGEGIYSLLRSEFVSYHPRLSSREEKKAERIDENVGGTGLVQLCLLVTN
jgi:hypothetical protein